LLSWQEECGLLIERFSEGSSPLHRIDPRVKVCLAFSYAFVIAFSNKIEVALAALILSVILIAIARLNPLHVLQNLRMLGIFLLMLWIFLPLTLPGEPLYSLGPIGMSVEGIAKALSVSLKSLSIVLMVVSLLGTSTVFSLVHAVSHFRIPKKLVYLTFLSYRYIYVIRDEYARLRNAMKIRGFRPRTNMHTYRTYGYLIGMLLIRSYERSERIYQAMLCRGFHGRFHLLSHFHMHGRDRIFAISMSLILFAIGIWEWTSMIL
jgi:cobalt/nickel transport system permease protein